VRYSGVAVDSIEKNTNPLLVGRAIEGPMHVQVRRKDGFIFMPEDTI
jgi:hypothetical protein